MEDSYDYTNDYESYDDSIYIPLDLDNEIDTPKYSQVIEDVENDLIPLEIIDSEDDSSSLEIAEIDEEPGTVISTEETLEESDVISINDNEDSSTLANDSTANQISENDTITIGSSKSQVLAIQGNPTEIIPILNKFMYNMSSIDFDEHDQVKGWDNYSKNLNILMESNTNNSSFTIGSSKEEVIAAQGTPTEIIAILNKFQYDMSSVDFNHENRVIGWDNYSKNLQVKMEATIQSSNFTVGSSKAEVISSMGTPTQIIDILNQWHYDMSSITFKDDIVVGWDNYGNNLKLR